MYSRYNHKEKVQSIYCYPQTEVYINHFEIMDSETLIELEADLTSIRLSELCLNAKNGRFGVTHLKNIHKYIFQDLYPFAGKIRVEDISKGNTQFCLCQYIEANLENVLGKLKREHFLLDSSREAFIKQIAYYMSELNVIHPFREGNGRTIREFVRQLALKNGYEINWYKIDSNALLKATILAVDFDLSLLEDCISQAIEAE
ncbi:Fic/DOC family protein [Fusibacter ferrireducens]|uniref:protein adenylyltransferase n=1 Tax=Fusibacter ferrireducens TaxID=2785058 RepID=A0ABS0A282_9FIRM|nr:Fic family protein [Fusibacter ferrireducens]MBF4695974.1 Fic family protein [Fusibacter ferrireducens]